MTIKRRRTGTPISPAEELPSSKRESRTQRRRKQGQSRVPKKFLMVLVLLGAFLFSLPWLVVNTPLKQMVLNRVLAEFGGQVTVQKISGGWLTAIEFVGVQATDEQGQTLIQIDRVKLPHSLISLLRATDLGTIEVQHPRIHLELWSDGSNLEDALAGMLSSEPSNDPAMAVQVAVTNGTIQVKDRESDQEFVFEKLNSLVQAFQADEAPLRISIAGTTLSQPESSVGSFQTRLVFDAGKTNLEFQNGLMEMTTEAFPMAAASPWLTRFVEPVCIAGNMHGSLQASWTDSGGSLQVRMDPVRLTQLEISAPRRIGADQIRLDSALFKGDLKITPQTIEADRLVCQTDIGSLNANGEMNWEQIARVAGAQIPANNFQADGTVHLAKLVHMLPETIPLQAGLQIETGTLQFQANSRVEGTDRRLVLNLESTGLTAIRDGQTLNWDKPARIVAAVRQTRDNLLYIESLDCRTKFLTLTGSATTANGEFRVQGDLKAALAEVQQFVDLGQMQLEGMIKGEFAWQFDGNPADALTSRPLRAGGQFHIDQPLVNLPGQATWSEQELNVLVQLAGQHLPDQGFSSRTLRLDSGKLELGNSQQSLEANLLQPVVNPGLGSAWNFDCQLAGNVQTWLAQLATWTPITAQASGGVTATASATLEPLKQLTVHQMSYEFSNLDFQGYGLQMTEPQLGGQAKLNFGFDSGRLEVTDATVASSAFSARAQNVILDPAATQQPISGQIAFVADVNRCLATLDSRPDPNAVQWFGRAEGTIVCAAAADSIGGQIQIKLNDLIAARYQRPRGGVQNVSSGSGSWTRLLDEKQVDLQSTLQLSHDGDRITFEHTRLVSAAVEFEASGSLTDLNGSLQTDLQGSWNPNWPRLKPLADVWLAGLANLDAVEGGGFRIRGPVFHPQAGQPGQPWLHPQFQLATVGTWQSGHALGLPIGAGKFDLQLANSVAEFNSNAVPFSGGTLQLRPQLDLRSETMVLRMPPLKVLDHVELTPDVCRSWLKYVAPAIAGATTAKGQISLGADHMQIPLGQWDAATVNGVVTVHQASVGPGPLGQQLFGMISQLKALTKGAPFHALPAAQTEARWLMIAEQEVPFALQNGRVFHQGMEFQVEGIVIRTSGSVGLDQSMDLVAEIPVLPSWLGNHPLTQGLKGQTLRIPIRGTVQKPTMDGRLLQNLSQRLFQRAAGSAISNELKGLLDQGNPTLDQELRKGLKGLLGPGK